MIKIAYTSDLHVDYSNENRELVARLSESTTAAKPDVLILGGDIAASPTDFGWALGCFAGLKCRKLVVAGNHDIWIESKSDILNGKDSGAKYRQILPQIAKDNDFEFLHNKVVVIEGVGFAGCMGWFDYSFRNHKFDDSTPLEQYRVGKWQSPSSGKNFLWNDIQYVWWLKDLSAKMSGFSRNDLCLSDNEIATLMAKSLSQQLDQLARESVRQIVVITHFVPNRELLDYRDSIPHDYFNAYHGSVEIERVIRSDSKISQVFFGHSHVAKDFTIDGIRYVSRPVGYLGSGRTVADASAKLAIVEI